MISFGTSRTFCTAAGRSALNADAAFENTGPSWPDFSEPIYAHFEYI